MKGFCSGSSIEIDLHLSELEVVSLRNKTLTGNIRRGHEENEKIGIELLVGDTGDEILMKLEILPEGTDFENTTSYKITLSENSYLFLIDGYGVIDRPIIGTKISIYKNKNS